MNAISRRSLLARGSLLLAAGAAAVNTPVHALAAKPQARSGNFKSIDMAMEQAVRDGTVAGVVATAAGPDSMIYEGAFGKANTVTGAMMRPDTVFWLLSMTKAFTATACMQLIEQGRIDPEHDAAKYLPQLANPMVLRVSTATASRACVRPSEPSRCVTCSHTPPAIPIRSGAMH